MTDKPASSRRHGSRGLVAMAASATREIVAVIVAILLALAINEWWEDHERTVRKTELTEKLFIELGENLTRLQASHEHHTSQLQLIQDRAAERDDLTEADYMDIHRALYRKGVFKPALLTDTNWEIAKLTDLISYMEMEDLRAFTQIFALQRMHAEQWEQNSRAQVFADAQDDPKRLVEFYANTLNETWWAEKTLLDALEQLLESKEKSSTAPASANSKS